MSALEIRPATPTDHGLFTRLVQLLVPDEAPVDGPRFEREIMPTTLIAESNGAGIGYTHFRILPDRGHLGHLVTAPEGRRVGVGRALMTAAIAKLKAAGSTNLTLNCRPQNAAALALYESFGLKPIRTNRALKLPWSCVPLAGPAATLLAPADDAARELEFGLAEGTLPFFRTRPDRVLLAGEGGEGGVTVYDTAFGGSGTFKARSLDAAWMLLRGIRPYSPNAEHIFLSLEDDAALTTALIEAGAILRMETLFMSRAI